MNRLKSIHYDSEFRCRLCEAAIEEEGTREWMGISRGESEYSTSVWAPQVCKCLATFLNHESTGLELHHPIRVIYVCGLDHFNVAHHGSISRLTEEHNLGLAVVYRQGEDESNIHRTIKHNPQVMYVDLMEQRDILVNISSTKAREAPDVTLTYKSVIQQLNLNFRSTFGLLLDSVNHAANYFSKLSESELFSINNQELDVIVRKYTEHVEPLIISRIPEYSKMSSYFDGYIHLHTLKCFICVHTVIGDCSKNNDRFSGLSFSDKNILNWALLLHDLGKIIEFDSRHEIQRDPIHPFKSATVAMKVLAKQVFTNAEMETNIENWCKLVNSAVVVDTCCTNTNSLYNRSMYALKHDNSILSDILSGLDDIFGTSTMVSDIIKLVLLHQSVTFIEMFPPAAPLTEAEIMQHFTPRLMWLLSLLTTVDSCSYLINNPENKKKYSGIIQDNAEKFMHLLDPDKTFETNFHFV